MEFNVSLKSEIVPFSPLIHSTQPYLFMERPTMVNVEYVHHTYLYQNNISPRKLSRKMIPKTLKHFLAANSCYFYFDNFWF